jgi:hypothetical protein
MKNIRVARIPINGRVVLCHSMRELTNAKSDSVLLPSCRLNIAMSCPPDAVVRLHVGGVLDS